jgi:cystathionine beta-lyase/cystathionine gamma-synthase
MRTPIGRRGGGHYAQRFVGNDQSPGTRAIAAGRGQQGTSLTPPLWGTSVWQTAGLDDTRKRATATRADNFYSRYANPTVRAFEEAIAELEDAEDALAFASGMGAVASVVFGLCSTGDHVVAQRQVYAGTSAFLLGPCARMGIDVTWVDGTEPGSFAAAVVPGKTMLVVAESPSNPRLDVVDLDELGAITGPFTLVDSTFATPLGQQPIHHGVDLVLHSATKGICGHNDATLGVVAGESDVLAALWAYSVLHGACASPFDALNGLRGLRTLAVRHRHQSAAALEIATALRSHPGVTAVHHPGLEDHPQHELAARQLAMMPAQLAIELSGGIDAARVTLDSLRVARSATSLGGPETLVCHPATSTHVSLLPDDQAAIGITDGLLRISAGLEDPADVVADLCQAIPS